MYSFVVVLFFTTVVSFSVFEYIKYDQASEVNIQEATSNRVAKNIFIYSGFLYQEAKNNPFNHQVDIRALNTSNNISYYPLVDYKMYVKNLGDQVVILNSWNNAIDRNILANDIFSQLSKIVNIRLHQDNYLIWNMPVIFHHDNCNRIISYSFIPNELQAGIMGVFKNTCKEVNAVLHLGEYVLFEAISLKPIY